MRLRKLSEYLPSRMGIMGINARNLHAVYAHNERRFFPNVDDKLRCKELMAAHDIPVLPTYHVVTGPSTLRRWENAVAGIEHFVIKPCHGFGGNGILLIHRTDGGFTSGGQALSAADVTHHILQICNGAFSLDNASETAYFEEMVINHPGIEPLIAAEAGGIADVRLILRYDMPVMSMVRIPTIESEGKANLHQGGIGIGIDLATGVTLDGCYRNNVITVHPDTGRPLRGYTIPGFGAMIEHGVRISQAVNLGYIGVDFACDARYGPIVLEVNARPGLNIQLANQCGLWSRLN